MNNSLSFNAIILPENGSFQTNAPLENDGSGLAMNTNSLQFL